MEKADILDLTVQFLTKVQAGDRRSPVSRQMAPVSYSQSHPLVCSSPENFAAVARPVTIMTSAMSASVVSPFNVVQKRTPEMLSAFHEVSITMPNTGDGHLVSDIATAICSRPSSMWRPW